MHLTLDFLIVGFVAPLVGAWIEIFTRVLEIMKGMSLLSWERGLKYLCKRCLNEIARVAPLVGAWIEIYYHEGSRGTEERSLLSWERGLKFDTLNQNFIDRFGRSSRGSVD